MKQKIIQKWQQLPSENRIEKKQIKQSEIQTKSPILTTKDLMGLSWILFEERQ
jgi:hypothetical protein